MNTTALLVTVVVGYFIPLISAFVTRQHWPEEVVGLVTVVLSVVVALVSEIAANPHEFSFTTTGLHAVVVWIVAYVARNQTWKTGPDGLSAKLYAFPQKLPPNGVQPGHEPEGLAA